MDSPDLDQSRLTEAEKFFGLRGAKVPTVGLGQAIALTVLFCLAVAAAAIAAFAATKSKYRRAEAAEESEAAAAAAAEAGEARSFSAPVTRHPSLTQLGAAGAKFASSERLHRFRLVGSGSDDDASEDAAMVIDEAELKFCTKLDMLEGILYLHSFRMRVRMRGGGRQLNCGRAVVEVRDGGGQRWRMEADLKRSGSGGGGGVLLTGHIEYVASLRLRGSCSGLPHEHRLLISALVAALRPDGQPAVASLDRLAEFPVHLANEPNMEFCASVSSETCSGELLSPRASIINWRQLQPTPAHFGEPRLHLGILFSPGPDVSTVSVRLVEVFDVADDDGDTGVTATVAALLTAAPAVEAAEAPVEATLTALPSGPGAFAFDQRSPPVVLTIDNRRLQTSGVGVTLCGIGPGRRAAVQLGDFARASAPSGMRQWNAALGNPNMWLWLTHVCRRLA